MKSSSNTPRVERAQPWLGTLVTVRVEGLPPARANRAIDAAFAEISTVHRLMSFHQESSDVAQLNRRAAREPVTVHRQTLEVLRFALRLSACSRGRFDVSVAKQLVEWKFLPRPALPARVGVDGASWRDIELRSDGSVRFHRPLWIDLGGIAKGYAVDRASHALLSHGAMTSVVNAGGDLRVEGRHAETIALDIGGPQNTLPVVQLREGSLASSTGYLARRRHRGQLHGPHVNGVSRGPAPTRRFVCVAAERCMVADALTKVVMVEGKGSAELLRQFQASAHLYDPPSGWQHLESKMAA